MTVKEKREFMIAQMPPKEYARILVKKHWANPKKEFACLAQLWGKESAWNHKAKSPSHDYGIPQRHMKHNTAAEIAAFMKSAHVQIEWGIGYIQHRYDSPCKALQSWLSRSKNGKGGWY